MDHLTNDDKETTATTILCDKLRHSITLYDHDICISRQEEEDEEESLPKDGCIRLSDSKDNHENHHVSGKKENNNKTE
eukprot:6396968-Ditylum_brightwellii.AAC.1